MDQCALTYYQKVDQLLNQVYQKVYKNLSKSEQVQLKTAQRAWLQQRDAYFTTTYTAMVNEGKFDPNSRDFQMVYNDKRCSYVYARIEALLKK
ncbi:MAG: hypothetical protein RL607_241 [Bacteroidota bacterium]|jgi:uncharacterized protein YecT (DUF1311 family)